MWPQTKAAYSGDEYVVKIRDREIRTALTSTTLSGTQVRKVVLPRFEDDGAASAPRPNEEEIAPIEGPGLVAVVPGAGLSGVFRS